MSKTVINFWLMPNADFDTLGVLQQEISNFEQQNRNIHIEPTIIPWAHAWDRLMNYYKHQDELAPPDVIQIGTTWVPSLTYLGVLRDMRDFFDYSITEDIIEPLKNVPKSPNTDMILCIPWFSDIRLLYFRKDVLKKFGFGVADIGDFESFRNVCMTIQNSRKSDDDIMAYKLSGHPETIFIHDIAPWLWGMGGNFLSSDLRRIAFDKPEARNAFKWYFHLVNDLFAGTEGKYGITPPGTFFSGRYAMEINGKSPFYNLANLKHSDFSPEVVENYDLTQVPKGPKGSFPFVGGSCLATPKLCRYPEEASEWIRYLISPESQLRHCYVIGAFPSRTSLLKEFFKGYEQYHEAITTALKNGITFLYTPYSSLVGSLEKIITAFTDRVLLQIRTGKFSEEIVDEEIAKAAAEANYITSIHS
ncbi:MAG: extracellular solute-binding protein [Candidatus Aureabacteria bacterium]|nr:extracellular solute-binding protein [Candidatus Auribacterota bacterium]